MNTLETGRQVVREMLGDDFLERRAATRTSFSATIQDYSDEVCFGTVWSRPDIDRKQRSIVNHRFAGVAGPVHAAAHPCRGRTEQRLHGRGTARDPVAGGGLCRTSGRHRRIPHCRGSAARPKPAGGQRMKMWALVESRKPLQMLEVDDPTPKGTEVIVATTHCGLCHSDLHFWEGEYNLGGGKTMRITDRGVTLPRAPGHEIVGTVVAVGPDAKGVKVGDKRIVYPWIGCGTCDRCRAGEENLCATMKPIGVITHGGMASKVVVPHPRYSGRLRRSGSWRGRDLRLFRDHRLRRDPQARHPQSRYTGGADWGRRPGLFGAGDAQGARPSVDRHGRRRSDQARGGTGSRGDYLRRRQLPRI